MTPSAPRPLETLLTVVAVLVPAAAGFAIVMFNLGIW